MTIDALLEKVPDGEKAELTILYNAHVASVEAVQKSATEANLRTYRAAKDALDRLTETLTARYFPQDDPPLAFKTRAEAFRHLKGLGYKIGKSKFFKDAGDGLVRFEPDGTITEKALDRYIKLAGIQKLSDLGGPGEDTRSLANKKQQWEVRRLEKQVERQAIEIDILKSKYHSNEDCNIRQAAALAVLDIVLRQDFRTGAHRLIKSVNGDPSCAPVLVQLYESILDKSMQNLSKTKFSVQFEKTPDIDSGPLTPRPLDLSDP